MPQIVEIDFEIIRRKHTFSNSIKKVQYVQYKYVMAELHVQVRLTTDTCIKASLRFNRYLCDKVKFYSLIQIKVKVV